MYTGHLGCGCTHPVLCIYANLYILEMIHELIYACMYVCLSQIMVYILLYGIVHFVYTVSAASEGTLLHYTVHVGFAPVLGCLAQWRDCCVEVCILQ